MFRQNNKNVFMFENYNLTSLDMYNNQAIIWNQKEYSIIRVRGHDTTASHKYISKTKTATGLQTHTSR